MPQKTSQNSLRNVALTASKAYRTKEGITVPEWDGVKVTLREPSGDAWVKFREIVNPQLAEGEEAPTLTEAEKFLRNKEADVVLFIDVLLDETASEYSAMRIRSRYLKFMVLCTPACWLRPSTSA